MTYVPTGTAAKFGKTVNLGIFIKIDFTPEPLRLWLGAHNVNQKLDNLEVSDSVWIGGGRWLEPPDIDAIINATGEIIGLRFEGVTAEALAAIAMDPADVLGVRVWIGMAAFDEDWQRDTDIIAIAHMLAQYWSIEASTVAGTDSATRVVTLVCASGETGRSRPRLTTYTDAQQRRISATDAFCQNVVRYDMGFDLSWPRFED